MTSPRRTRSGRRRLNLPARSSIVPVTSGRSPDTWDEHQRCAGQRRVGASFNELAAPRKRKCGDSRSSRRPARCSPNEGSASSASTSWRVARVSRSPMCTGTSKPRRRAAATLGRGGPRARWTARTGVRVGRARRRPRRNRGRSAFATQPLLCELRRSPRQCSNGISRSKRSCERRRTLRR
jgi:hypothetical protein